MISLANTGFGLAAPSPTQVAATTSNRQPCVSFPYLFFLSSFTPGPSHFLQSPLPLGQLSRLTVHPGDRLHLTTACCLSSSLPPTLLAPSACLSTPLDLVLFYPAVLAPAHTHSLDQKYPSMSPSHPTIPARPLFSPPFSTFPSITSEHAPSAGVFPKSKDVFFFHSGLLWCPSTNSCPRLSLSTSPPSQPKSPCPVHLSSPTCFIRPLSPFPFLPPSPFPSTVSSLHDLILPQPHLLLINGSTAAHSASLAPTTSNHPLELFGLYQFR